MHYFYTVNTPGIPVPEQKHPVLFDVPNPMEHENGAPKWEYLDTAPGQDIIAWITQGSVAKRDKERLGLSDTGIVMFRKMLSDSIQAVQEGREPMNTFRDPEMNECVRLQTELEHAKLGAGPPWKYSPMTTEVRALFAERNKAGVAVPESPTAMNPYQAELAHFLDSLERGVPPSISPRDGLEAVRIALAAIESIETGRPVTLA